MAKDLLIGSHVSMNAPEYYLGSVKEAISYGSSTFMFYTGAPQNSYRKPLNELKIAVGHRAYAANALRGKSALHPDVLKGDILILSHEAAAGHNGCKSHI